jgi:hypothetical protein
MGEVVTKVLINPIIRTRTRHLRRVYHTTRDSILYITERGRRNMKVAWVSLGVHSQTTAMQ